jgi:proliferating cell nuclear antigen PCNA
LEDVNIDILKDTEEQEGGIMMSSVNPTASLLIKMKLLAKKFDGFKCKPNKFSIGINLIEFYRFLKSVQPDENLVLYVNEDDLGTLYMKTFSDKKHSVKTVGFKLMDIDNNKNVNNYVAPTYDVVVTMNSGEFHKICKQMKTVTDQVEITCMKDAITFCCKGENTFGRYQYEHSKDKDDKNYNYTSINFKNDKEKIVTGIYDLKDLVLFNKYSNLAQQIQIHIKNKSPLMIKYMVGSLGALALILTPIDESTFDNCDNEEAYGEEEKYYDEAVEVKADADDEEDDDDKKTKSSEKDDSDNDDSNSSNKDDESNTSSKSKKKINKKSKKDDESVKTKKNKKNSDD